MVVCLVPVMSRIRMAARSAKAVSSGGKLKFPSRLISCSSGSAPVPRCRPSSGNSASALRSAFVSPKIECMVIRVNSKVPARKFAMAGSRSSVAIDIVTMPARKRRGGSSPCCFSCDAAPPRFGRCRCRGVRRAPGGIWDLRRRPIRRRCGSRWSCSCGCWMCGWCRCGGRRGCR